jgi:phenylalanyl-tRNA synthetase beta chain
MIVSYNWLKELIDIDKTPYEIRDILTNHGIEVNSIKYLGSYFSGVVSAQILEMGKHPNADKLSLCKVSDGKEEFQIVCGANNIFTGAKVPLAKLDAKLGELFIKKVKIRDVESFGMLCSEKELGIAKDSSGVLILPENTNLGEDVKNILDLDDYLLEIEVTPNRGDCLSVMGIARELHANSGKTVNTPIIKDFQLEGYDNLEVQIKNNEACLRYIAYVVSDISIADSPLWMKNRLRNMGLRSINPIVDITNYILLETGHPMHAFDYNTIEDKKIIVRNASKGEKIVTLDGVARELSADDLVIADIHKPIAIAGIMGGEYTGVNQKTEKIVFESAYFNPVNIRKTAKRLGISSESSYRFERGVCWDTTLVAMKRAIHLLKTICPKAKIVKEWDLIAKDFKVLEIMLDKNKVDKIIGRTYDESEIISILVKLGFEIKPIQNNYYKVKIPAFRNDVTSEIDLVEEIARVSGYEKISEKKMSLIPSVYENTNQDIVFDKIKNYFLGQGFCEAKNYSFASKKLLDIFNVDQSSYWEISNPLSEEEAIMVNTRMPRLIQNAVNSIRRQIRNIKLFEIGKVFSVKEFEPKKLEKNEKLVLSGVMSGDSSELYWKEKSKPLDLYFVSGLITGLLDSLRIKYNLKNSNKEFLDKTSSIEIYSLKGEYIGLIGLLAKNTLKKFDVKNDIYVWELDVDRISNIMDTKVTYKKVSDYPMVERDLSLIVPKNVIFQVVIDEIKNSAGDLLIDVNIFDVYEGKPIKEGFKNIAIRLFFQSFNETLSEELINKLQNKILEGLNKKNNIVLRQE